MSAYISNMDFSDTLIPYAWIWWTAAIFYNPAVNMIQSRSMPYLAAIKKAWGLWNAAFAAFSLVGFLLTCRWA